MAIRTSGCVNISPQAIEKITISAASRMKIVMMPEAYAKFSRKARRRSEPACWTKLITFKPTTGSTQGMKLRMNPPSNAKPKITGNPIVVPPDDSTTTGAEEASEAASSLLVPASGPDAAPESPGTELEGSGSVGDSDAVTAGSIASTQSVFPASFFTSPNLATASVVAAACAPTLLSGASPDTTLITASKRKAFGTRQLDDVQA